MDPLTLTTSALTLIEVAAKVKESVDKVSVNRARLSRLAAEVARGITDIQEYCETHQKTQDLVGAKDLRDALDAVSRELFYVLRRCEKVLRHDSDSPLSKARYRFLAWFNRAELEDDILRLKEQVQACHLRFLSFSSARTEQNVLMVLHDNQSRAHQLDGLMALMLLQNDDQGRDPPAFIDEAPIPGDAMCMYFVQQLKTLLSMAKELIATRTDWFESPNLLHRQEHGYCTPRCMVRSQAISFRLAFFSLLDSLRIVKQNSKVISAQDLAYSLCTLARDLDIFGAPHEAVSVLTVSIELYSLVVERNPCSAFLYHLAFVLTQMSQFGIDLEEALVASRDAVTLCSQLYSVSETNHHAEMLVCALNNLTHSLRVTGDVEGALKYSKEVVSIVRQIPDPHLSTSAGVTWWGSGEAGVVYTSRREITRTPTIAHLEAHTLTSLAWNLGLLGHHTEAFIAGFEAMNCFQALISTFPGASSSYQTSWTKWFALLQREAPSWVSITRCP
ncbi:hypothetical protein HGRIS_006016 [Hohenbuehelia grisea]|uniref:Uncharacterized protein n=1 Tax=Hohenbuehelia grisea TaxID=104357 RepID=A0ABR3JYI7_9AGAR